MRTLFSTVLALGLAVAVTGCAGASTTTPTPTTSASESVPAIDPTLIPTAAPTDAFDVDPDLFTAAFGDYTFKVGDGPTWCTINIDNHFVICEQNEAKANYRPIAAPSDCELSYGYQVRLWAETPTDGTPVAGFVCSGGAYADPEGMYSLNPGERLVLDGFTCFVENQTARCDNAYGKFVVLGPDAWAIGS